MIMKYKDFINGGVKYHFEEKDEKLYLLSVEIWGKEFVFPDGGIAEKDSVSSEQIVDGSIQLEDLSDEAKAQMVNETIGEEAAHELVANIIAEQEGKPSNNENGGGTDSGD